MSEFFWLALSSVVCVCIAGVAIVYIVCGYLSYRDSMEEPFKAMLQEKGYFEYKPPEINTIQNAGGKK